MTIAKLGTANNRVKDLYDLCLLAQRFEFEGALSAGRSSDILILASRTVWQVLF